jgi:hypothetical protein
MKVCGREIHIEGKLIRIGHLEGDKYESLNNPLAALQELRTSGVGIDIFTFLEKLPHTTPQYHWPMESDNLAVLPVSTFEHWWTKQLNNKTRNMVRRAEKNGVVVREVPFDDRLVQGIWTIYNEVPNRQGKPFPHYGKDLETVRRISATFPDQSTFIGAFLEDSLIGFVKLVSDKDRGQASLMHIVSMYQHRDKAPTNALIAQAVRSCAEREIPYLVYSNFAYGRKQRDTLSDFKEYNGFRRVDLPRYYVPLTLAGRVALRLRLHRRLTDRIPESVQEKIRDLRRLWYNRSPQVSRKPSSAVASHN